MHYVEQDQAESWTLWTALQLRQASGGEEGWAKIPNSLPFRDIHLRVFPRSSGAAAGKRQVSKKPEASHEDLNVTTVLKARV